MHRSSVLTFVVAGWLTLSLPVGAEISLDCDDLPACGSEEEGVKEAWIQGIDDWATLEPLTDCHNNVDDIADELANEGGWTVHEEKGFANAVEDDWRDDTLGGNDDNKVDRYDIAYICGHGGANEVGRPGDSFGYFNPETVHLHSEEANWGNVDLEWVVLDYSESLRNGETNRIAWFTHAFDYLHLLIGWHDSPKDTDSGFQFFDDLVDTGVFDGGGNQMLDAWTSNLGGCSWQPSGTTQMVIGEEQWFKDDYIHGESSGAANDQLHDAVFYYWTHDC